MNQSNPSYSSSFFPPSSSYKRTPASGETMNLSADDSNYTRPLPLYNKNTQEEPRMESIDNSNPYKTRERLYFEPEDDQDEQDNSLGVVNNDNRPPKTSIYDFSLTPERKYQKSKTTSCVDTIGMPSSDLSLGDDCWITVFGFHPSASDQILQYFCNLGSVVNYELGQGNWYHIQYSNKWSAQKAQCKNGMIIPFSSLSMMIGVLPTKAAMNQIDQSASKLMSPLSKHHYRTGGSQANATDGSVFRRPLAATAATATSSSMKMETPSAKGFDPSKSHYTDGNYSPMDLSTPSTVRRPPLHTSASSSSLMPLSGIPRINTLNATCVIDDSATIDRNREEEEGGLVERVMSYILGW